MLRQWRTAIALTIVASFAFGIVTPQVAFAGTTGTITGTVRDSSTGAPIANVRVSAAAPSGTASSTTNGQGFFALQSLIPDTYTVSFQGAGYEPVSIAGITVQQDQTVSQDQRLNKALTEIASVRARGASNLVQPNVASDVYNVAGAQLNAASGGDNLHKTIYEYLATVPGVTSSGYPSQPRIHGAAITDVGYEFDGIPIKERITGFFTTNLSNVGISNVEVYTGGLSAGDAGSGAGLINSVVKTGTYPAFSIGSYGITAPANNQLLTLEYGGATPNRKLSYYGAMDYVYSHNYYNNGQYTFPGILFCCDGPGIVKTVDLVGNFHYKPNANNDFQFLVQNGEGEFNFNYLLNRNAGEPQNLALQPCPGATLLPGSASGGTGGTAPNGQPCPTGLYFSPLTNGTGNIWHHYSGIGKIQWNHILNDHSFFALRFAENFNQYIFDQPVADPNLPQFENPGQPYNSDPRCPLYPYQAGTPLQAAGGGAAGPAFGNECTYGSEVFYGDRSSRMYLGALDYTNSVNAHTTVKFGIGHERDNNLFSYYLTYIFCSAAGSPIWPCNYLRSNYPDDINYAYLSGSFKVGKFLLEPGARYQSMSYHFPVGGTQTTSILNPTFAGTYQMGANDTIRYSFTDSTSFVGTGYVYRDGSSLYNPTTPGFTMNPTIIHSSDLMFEHQINYNTSIRVGPWMNKATDIYQFYRPIVGTNSNGSVKFGPSLPSNGGIRKAFGAELALNHIDNRDSGVSYWLTGTYDNFWTNLSSSLYGSYNQSTIPTNIYQSGQLIRSSGNPLLNASLVADFHSGRFSALPTIYYQTPSFYNVGVTSQCTLPQFSAGRCAANGGTVVPPFISQNELTTSGYFKVNLTLLERLGPDRNNVLGVRISNLTNNTNDVFPCTSNGAGCAPFDGPNSGVAGPAGQSIYQNYSQSPLSFELFFTKKMP